MNPDKIPKRVSTLNPNQSIDQFNVPRSQIKPYLRTYEEIFEGQQKPINILINTTTNLIHEDPLNHQNEQYYQSLFHIYSRQLQMGYIIQ